ncbi:unnamed protein product [Brugia pahangi]|uniref:Ovule protein n=1 Tax=Brugia pahangi TaxID=6280 RepID=A0A0N4SXX9_BRUPA|nr:unnamed protein product [Brugia pahangi]
MLTVESKNKVGIEKWRLTEHKIAEEAIERLLLNTASSSLLNDSASDKSLNLVGLVLLEISHLFPVLVPGVSVVLLD